MSEVATHPATGVFFVLLTVLLGLVWRLKRDARALSSSNLGIVLLLWLIFLGNFRWRGSGDVVASSLQPFAVLREGHLYLDHYYKGFLDDDAVTLVQRRNGHVISIYGSAPGLLLVPFYVLPAVSGAEVTDLLIHQLQKIGASFMVALSAYFVLLTLCLWVERKWAILLTLAYALGTSSLSVSSQAIWQHGPSQLFISAGLYGLARMLQKQELNGLIWCGFLFAMAAWCRYSNIFVYAAILAFVTQRFGKKSLAFLAGSIVPFCAILADNYFHSGSLLTTGYPSRAAQFTWNLLPGVSGLLMSPARGLILFSPVVLFAIWGFARSWMDPAQILWRYMSMACLAVLLFYGSYTFWEGGWCFGPRYLADVAPLWIMGMVPVVQDIAASFRLKQLFFMSFIYSIIVQLVGAFFSWHWEAIADRKPWNAESYPIFYLVREAFTVRSADHVEGIAVLVMMTALWAWFILGPVMRQKDY